jgi:hypothetical protein
MSKGPGAVERRIADLFAEARDRALSVSDIAEHAFELGGQPATRVQRLSATRAAHRLLRRIRDTQTRYRDLFAEARRNAAAAMGVSENDLGALHEDHRTKEFYERMRADPAYRKAEALQEWARRFGIWNRVLRVEDKPGWLRIESDDWRTTRARDGTLYFHRPDVPLQVWAVSIQPTGVIWAEAEITRITARNVMVRYAGEIARLDREGLWKWWAFWRRVRFASSRTGRIAAALDELWQERYGQAASGAPPAMQMPLAEAMALLDVPADYTYDDVIAAFRREAKKAHPDMGGTAEMFRKLVEARDRLLAAIGTSAPAPKMPEFAPKGIKIRYRRVRLGSSQRRLGTTRRLARG